MGDQSLVIEYLVMEIVARARLISDDQELDVFARRMCVKIRQAVRAQDSLLTEKQVAGRYSCLGVKQLQNYRTRGGGPPYLKFGPHRRSRVLYRVSDVESWIAQHEEYSPLLSRL